jgi:signal transduction histidine kinase
MDLPEVIFLSFCGVFAYIAYSSLRREKKMKIAYANLLSKHTNMSGAANHVPHAICIITPEKRIGFVNPSMKYLLSLSHDSISLREFLEKFPNPFSLSENIDNALTLHRSTDEKNLRLGEQLVHLSIRPLKHMNGQLSGVAIILTDKKAEQSALQMKEDFTKVISHELRSPLTTIRAASQFIKMQDGKLGEAERNKLLSMIDEQTEKLLYEIELILDAAKLEGNELELHPEKSDVNEFLGATLPLLFKKAEAKHITTLVRIQPGVPEASFDKKYFRQALGHIISNSIKFTNSGGEILVDVKREEDALSLTIADTGCGIPQAKQKTLFSRFSHISSPSENIGIGLGLYLAKGIIEEHGGTISLSSEEGVGTTVTIHLPLQAAYTQPSEPLYDKAPIAYNGYSTLN